MLQRCTICC